MVAEKYLSILTKPRFFPGSGNMPAKARMTLEKIKKIRRQFRLGNGQIMQMGNIQADAGETFQVIAAETMELVFHIGLIEKTA